MAALSSEMFEIARDTANAARVLLQGPGVLRLHAEVPCAGSLMNASLECQSVESILSTFCQPQRGISSPQALQSAVTGNF
jgi:hypothetical protein